MGAVASLFRRTAVVRAPERDSFRFVCHLDRLPPHLPELDESFRQLPAATAQVECVLEGEDFAEAVADAIRTLEDGFVQVVGVERL